MKLISIVVPIYNMEKFMVRCMKSLLSQTYKNIEILLIDDGSTDDSVNICNRYAQEYVGKVHVIHKENGGLSSARNTGIEHAKGNYIIFPDPDDWVEPDYIEKAIKYQEKYNADLVCLGHYIDYDNKCILANPNGTMRCMNKQEARRSLLVSPAMNGFAWNKLYHLDIIQKNDLTFRDDVGTTEDLDFAFRYLDYCKKICFVPEERVYHYYQRPDATTHGKFSKKRVESIRTYEKIMEQSESDAILKKVAGDEICNTAINLIWLYQRDKYDDRTLWKQLKNYIKRYLCGYLKSENYNMGRKVQALLAYFVPKLYVKLKNRLQEN